MTSDVPSLILASSSPQRRRLLREAGYLFEIVAPHESAECGICSSGGPATLVVELAVSKAADVAAQLNARGHVGQSAIILACDTVAECGGEVLGKPRDEAHARSMLERLRGRVHRVYSGVCVWPVATAKEPATLDVRLATSELEMDAISDGQLDEYLASGLWKGKAGAFGYQDRVGWLRLLKGSDSNVIGLPVELLPAMLGPLGIEPVRSA